MLRQTPYRLPISIALAILYTVFFWEEKLGLNLFLFSSLLIGLIIGTNPEARSSRSVWVTAIGSLLTALLVLVYNSGTAKVVHFLSLFVFVGFVHLPKLNFLGYAIPSALTGYFHLGSGLKQEWQQLKESHHPFRKLVSYLRLLLVPLLVLGVFGFLFYQANAPFAEMMNRLGIHILGLFADVQPLRWLFFVSGFLAVSGIIFSHNVKKPSHNTAEQV